MINSIYWNFSSAIQDIIKQEKINLKLRIIPNDVLDKEAVEKGEIKFFELAYFNMDMKVEILKLSLKITNFVIPHMDIISEDVQASITKWTDWIDYLAVDFDFQNDTFNNGWISYRTKADREIKLKTTHIYLKPGKYKVFVKVIDIFGVDTSQIVEVNMK
jgi:adenine-specific DNA-methyltransferase